MNLKYLRDVGGVGEHGDNSLDIGKIFFWYHSWWLVADAIIDPCLTLVNKLDGSLVLDCSNSSSDILRDDIPW